VSVAVVLETYNLEEAADARALTQTLRAARRELDGVGGGALVVAEATGERAVRDAIVRSGAAADIVDAAGLGYDSSKMLATREVDCTHVVWLDADCTPEGGWLAAHLRALTGDGTAATAGVTRYERGLLSGIMTIADFGFLLPLEEGRVVGCYSSNNVGFDRARLLELPTPEGNLRCQCYSHTQLLERRGSPVRLVPTAVVRHGRVPLVKERFRRGYEVVIGARDDPALPEAALLSAPDPARALYRNAVEWDRERLALGPEHHGLSPRATRAASTLLPLLRLVDLAGMAYALRRRPAGRRPG
jgi:hypothetical protein